MKTFLARHLLVPWMAACGLAMAPAQAATVDFSGSGFVNPGVGFDAGSPVWPLQVLASSSDYTVGGRPGWTMSSRFVFSFITNTGSGSFELADGLGSSLAGLIETVLDPTNGLFGGFDLTYVVSSGTGAYAGLAGVGWSEVALTSNPTQLPTSFTESGRFVVPEPPAVALAVAGLALLATSRRRARPV